MSDEKAVNESRRLRDLQEEIRLEATGYLAAEDAMCAASKELRRRDVELWRYTVRHAVMCDVAGIVGHPSDDDQPSDEVREQRFRKAMQEIANYVDHECRLPARVRIEMQWGRTNLDVWDSKRKVSDEVLRNRASLPGTLGVTEAELAEELLAARRVLRELAKRDGSLDEASSDARNAFDDYRDEWGSVLDEELMS